MVFAFMNSSLPKASVCNAIILGKGFKIWILGDMNIQNIAVCKSSSCYLRKQKSIALQLKQDGHYFPYFVQSNLTLQKI